MSELAKTKLAAQAIAAVMIWTSGGFACAGGFRHDVTALFPAIGLLLLAIPPLCWVHGLSIISEPGVRHGD
jgi:hypothetical protein